MDNYGSNPNGMAWLQFIYKHSVASSIATLTFQSYFESRVVFDYNYIMIGDCNIKFTNELKGEPQAE